MRVEGMQTAMNRIATIQRRFASFQVPVSTATPRQDPAAYPSGITGASAAEANQVFTAQLGTPVPVQGLDGLPGPGALDEMTSEDTIDILPPTVAGPRTELWEDRLPAAGRPWADEISAAASAAGIDSRLLASVVWQESSFRPDAVSHAGAIGLSQLMPSTALGLGVDPRDPVQNLQGGARYLAEQLDRFGSTELALAAYNAGPGRVSRAGGIPDIAETRGYVSNVIAHLEHLGGTP